MARKIKDNWRVRPRLLPENLNRIQYSEQIALKITSDMKAQLVALSYLRGLRGEFAPVVRDFLAREIRRYVAVELDPEEREEYSNILEHAQAVLSVRRQEMEEQVRKERTQEAAMINDRSDQFGLETDGDPGEAP